MTYKEAELEVSKYHSIIGRSILNNMAHIDARKITSILITPAARIRQVYSDWWGNGHNNLKAVAMATKKENFEVFLISYNPSVDAVIYYLKLSTYLRLA